MITFKKKGQLLTILALAMIGSMTLMQPAQAQEWRGGPPHPVASWHQHEIEARRWHHRHVVPVPGVVYAPPAVVYAPPPPPPGINLVIPLDFR